jgi:NAD(P)-dependent dehydrogenase (short-subunit alcohol dehydrogenase family)
MRLDGKIAVVTGGCRGIGRATAELFAREGATVIAADVSEAEPFVGRNIEFRRLDVTSPDGWGVFVVALDDQYGRIDVLMNNAGTVGSYDALDTIPLSDWERVVALNQTGPFLGMRFVVPIMRRNGGGSIINVSSIWGIAGAAGVSAYVATKGAVRMMSKNAALSFVDDHIRVNSLHPGIIETPMIAAQDATITEGVVNTTPMRRMGRPEEIAYGALFLACDESSYMTGAELVIDGGYTAQ